MRTFIFWLVCLECVAYGRRVTLVEKQKQNVVYARSTGMQQSSKRVFARDGINQLESLARLLLLSPAAAFGPASLGARPVQNRPTTSYSAAAEARRLSDFTVPTTSMRDVSSPSTRQHDPTLDLSWNMRHGLLLGLGLAATIGIATPAACAADAAILSRSSNGLLQSLENFVTGGIAGSLGAAAVYPVDFVKTRLQNERTPQGQLPKYQGAMDCFTKTVKEEGPLALYQGLLPQVVGVWPEKAIKLTVNDAVRKAFADPVTGAVALPLEILAGGAGGFSQDIFTNPLEIVKVRLQVADGTTKKQSAMEIMQELGFLGLYQGVSMCLARDVPFSAIYFPAFAHLKTSLAPAGEDPGVLTLLLAGAIAAIPAAYLVTPADVIKTRLQVKPEDGQDEYKNAWDCFQRIVDKEGWQALFKGGVQRIVRSSPQFAVTLATYNLLNRWVESLHLF